MNLLDKFTYQRDRSYIPFRDPRSLLLLQLCHLQFVFTTDESPMSTSTPKDQRHWYPESTIIDRLQLLLHMGSTPHPRV